MEQLLEFRKLVLGRKITTLIPTDNQSDNPLSESVLLLVNEQ